MESWARSYQNSVQFLCVCVETNNAQRVATFFHHTFNFTLVVNAYIPSMQYMPRGFGQLGCSGFVVSDGDGNFVSRKTKAYLDSGEEAFDHVEQILAGLLRDKVVAANFSSSSQQPSQKTTVAMDEYLTVPSVGVSSMDHEHETCLTALKNLIQSPSKKNLQVVYEELVNHFAHEEALMVEHGFGGMVGDPFSPLTSHIKDHRRILDLIEHELKLGNNTSAAGTCNSTIVDGVAS
ncbi:hypothetical protein IV203_007625 [Nitzschia inconspicua]|uniref:Hemerythrin-like domain-containing protein n=1 Tax=Nitzschia inconspicua TaxID=303405 RepID=A0A9K3KFH7_9STRA|nr:hypothetical protein IV203_007625 [Nitzschia inconspicua]